MRSTLAQHQQTYEELKADIRNGVAQQAQELEIETWKARDKSNRNLFYRIVYFLKIKNLSRRRSSLEKNLESIIKNKTSSAEDKVVRLEGEIAVCLENKRKIISERYKESIEDLTYTKEVVDAT